MPKKNNNKDKGKGDGRRRTKMLGIWLTPSEKAKVDARMAELGIKTYADFVRHQLGLPAAPRGRPYDDRGEGK